MKDALEKRGFTKESFPYHTLYTRSNSKIAIYSVDVNIWDEYGDCSPNLTKADIIALTKVIKGKLK